MSMLPVPALKVPAFWLVVLGRERQYARWYDGYQIVISEVVRTYGDGRMPHLAAGDAG